MIHRVRIFFFKGSFLLREVNRNNLKQPKPDREIDKFLLEIDLRHHICHLKFIFKNWEEGRL